MAKRMAVAIVPAPDGFGLWQPGLDTDHMVSSISEAAVAFSDGLTNEAIPVAELDDEHDISGLVREEPYEMYAIPDGYGTYIYFGLI